MRLGRPSDMVRVLTFTTLYPNAAQPNHGVFVENRLRHTVALGGVEATVLAPIPYFPFKSERFGHYSRYARAPREEHRNGLRVVHPRYLVIPKIGMRMAPGLLYRSALAAFMKLKREGLEFDVIDAHYFYPDGVVAARLGQTLGLPVVITGRGSDLTLFPRYPSARRQIIWAARHASAIITVCQALKDKCVSLGMDEKRIRVLRNGVDLKMFSPQPRDAARQRLGFNGFVLLSVGGLIPRKGHHLVVEALKELDDCRLVIVGGGPMRQSLLALAQKLGVEDRVTLLGEVPHDRMAEIYTAADLLVLASEHEGWANVLLESMACGTPVVATNVDGTSEVVTDRAGGLLVNERTPAQIAATIRAMRAAPTDRQSTRRYAEQFDWDIIAEANRALLTSLAAH